MALSRTWYTQANCILDDTTTALRVMQSIAWANKALLKAEKTGTTGTNGAPPVGSRWVVVGSSDGVTAALDGVDRWGATFDATKLVRAAAGVAHSWILLQSPTGITGLGVPLYRLISLGTPDNARIKITDAKTAFTGGSITADPTSTNQVTYSGSTIMADVTVATHRANYVTDANGNYFITFARAGGAEFHTIFAFLGFADMPDPVNDLFPFTAIVDSRLGSRGALSGAGAVLATGGGNTTEGLAMRSPDGTGVTTAGEGTNIIMPVAGAWNTRTNNNQANGKHDTLKAFVNYYTSTLNLGAIRGTIPDWWVANSAKPVGNTEPAVGTSEHVLVGNIYVPNDGVIPLI